MSVPLFVYGTLKAGHSHHHLLGNRARLVGRARTGASWTLVDAGGYPGLVPDAAAAGVTGEVFQIPESLLPELDAYEGVPEGLYRREWMDLELDGGASFRAQTYFFHPPADRPNLPAIGPTWPKSRESAG